MAEDLASSNTSVSHSTWSSIFVPFRDEGTKKRAENVAMYVFIAFTTSACTNSGAICKANRSIFRQDT